MKTNWKLWVSLAIPLLILIIPVESFGIEGLDIIQQRVIALFFLAALLWILEPIPIYATSLIIIVLELVTISSSGFGPLIGGAGGVGFGELIPYQDNTSTHVQSYHNRSTFLPVGKSSSLWVGYS